MKKALLILFVALLSVESLQAQLTNTISGMATVWETTAPQVVKGSIDGNGTASLVNFDLISVNKLVVNVFTNNVEINTNFTAFGTATFNSNIVCNVGSWLQVPYGMSITMSGTSLTNMMFLTNAQGVAGVSIGRPGAAVISSGMMLDVNGTIFGANYQIAGGGSVSSQSSGAGLILATGGGNTGNATLATANSGTSRDLIFGAYSNGAVATSGNIIFQIGCGGTNECARFFNSGGFASGTNTDYAKFTVRGAGGFHTNKTLVSFMGETNRTGNLFELLSNDGQNTNILVDASGFLYVNPPTNALASSMLFVGTNYVAIGGSAQGGSGGKFVVNGAMDHTGNVSGPAGGATYGSRTGSGTFTYFSSGGNGGSLLFSGGLSSSNVWMTGSNGFFYARSGAAPTVTNLVAYMGYKGLLLGSGLGFNRVQTATNYNTSPNNLLVSFKGSTTLGTLTNTLHQETQEGRVIIIKDAQNSALLTNILVLTTGGQTIDGASSRTMGGNGECLPLVFDGVSNWEVCK